MKQMLQSGLLLQARPLHQSSAQFYPNHPTLYYFLLMSVQTINPRSTSSLTLPELISLHSDLANFFAKNSKPQGYQELAVQLLREGIAARQPKDKHYHVAFVKHNRFLSPSQKQAVAPKVTEVIPLSPQPHKIYGKPKVKLNDQFLVEEQYVQTKDNLLVECPEPALEQQQNTFKRVDPTRIDEKVKDSEIESEKYLSPSSSKQLYLQSRQKIASPVKFPQKKSNQKHKDKLKQIDHNGFKESPNLQPKHKNTIKDKAGIVSPKQSAARIEKYDNIESRIKFLIDRDKKNKKIQRELQEQNKKISQLEERQQRLLIRQFQQKKSMQLQRESGHELGCCCCSSDEQITRQLLKLRGKVNEKEYKRTLSKIKQRLEPKSKIYKISSNPVYPMSSSSDSQSSSEQIVVAAMY